MFRFSKSFSYRHGATNGPQVLGARVPSFKNYPARASEVLVLYREFWRLVMMHPPNEQPDLAVKLRNEFRRGRLLRSHRAVDRAVRKAEYELNFWRSLVDTKTTRAEGRCVPLLQPSAHLRGLSGGAGAAAFAGTTTTTEMKSGYHKSASSGSTVKVSRQQSSSLNSQQQQKPKFFSVSANTVDGVWQAVQSRGQGAVPNLPNLKRSKNYSRSRSNLGHGGFI